MRSLLMQLSKTSETLETEFLAFYQSARKKGFPTTSLVDSDTEKLITSAISQTGKVFVVIDAFDECGEEDKRTLISLFRSLLDLGSCQVKILLTGRPEWELRLSLKSRLSGDLLTYEIGTHDTVQDIERFVAQGVDSRIESKELLSGRPVSKEFRQYLITMLTEGADGMYVTPLRE